MFGARGPCLSPEDPGGGAPPAPPPGGDPPAPSPAPVPAEITFTPEQQAVINKLVGQARVEGRNAATRAPVPVPVVTPVIAPQPEQKLTLEDIARELAETKMRARFDKQALRRGFSDDAADDLFDLYKAHKPTDDENWFTEREKRLVLKQPATQPTTTPSIPVTTPPVTVPSTAPISDRGAATPNGAIGWRFEMGNPIGMSAAARAQMDAELGPDAARKQRLAAAQAQAQTMRVTIK